MKNVCKRVGRFVYSEKESECRTQAIFARELSVHYRAEFNCFRGINLSIPKYQAKSRAWLRAIGFEPGLRTRASFSYYSRQMLSEVLRVEYLSGTKS